MNPEYKDIIFSDFLEHFNGYDIDCSVIKANISSEIKNESYPIIQVDFSFDYLVDNSINDYLIIDENGSYISKKINFKNELPITSEIEISIITVDLEQSVLLEERIKNIYTADRKLKAKIIKNCNENIVFNVRPFTGKVERKKDGEKYVSIIKISCMGCVALVEEYHPAKVYFDDNLRYNIIKIISAYYDMAEFIEGKLPFYAFEESEDEYVLSDNDKALLQKSKKAKEIAEELRVKTEVIDDKYADPFFIKKILLYSKSSGYNINNGIAIFEEYKDSIIEEKTKKENQRISELKKKKNKDIARKKKEKELKINEEREKNRRINAENYLNAKGDPEVNRYIDAVICNLKEHILVDFEFKIYGGTTYMEYVKDRWDNNLQYPCIVIKQNVNFSLNYNRFHLRTHDGNFGMPYNDFETNYPWNFGVTIWIYYNNEDTYKKTKVIEKQISETYKTENEIWVPLLNDEKKSTLIGLKYKHSNYKKEDDQKDSSNKYLEMIFYQSRSVYFVTNYDADMIDTNPKLQFSLLQRVELFMCVYEYYKKAIKEIQTYFPYCFLGKIGFDTLSPAQNNIKKMVKNNQYISRELFYEGFPLASYIFPFVYDRFVQKFTLEQIINEMIFKMNSSKTRYIKILNDLKLKNEYISEYYKIDMNNVNDIRALINYIDSIDEPLTDTLIEKYLKKYDSNKKFWNMVEEQNRKSKEEYERQQIENNYYNDNYASGNQSGGFVRDAAAVAFGSYISDKLAKKREQKERNRYRCHYSCNNYVRGQCKVGSRPDNCCNSIKI